ncbi:biliverdin-producing heme oxygenase [Dietzia sp.]|uniref:biliverdin-producing heme oxygenase n=1 Tax=Dietzia sp. TaxID=1871616 RepID=UPI002FDB70A6
MSVASATDTATSSSLAAGLRTATAEVHERAENSIFMGSLLGGELDKLTGIRAFAAMQRQYLHVYAALEAAVRTHAASPALAGIVDPALERAGRLEGDLRTLEAVLPTGEELYELTPATLEYARELDALAARNDADEVAAELVGHHYVRYLGDLSGGQVISRLMGRHYGVPEEALSFYSFDIEKPKVYKDGYRDALDALPLDGRLTELAVDAASRAFDHNTELFRSLEPLVRS